MNKSAQGMLVTVLVLTSVAACGGRWSGDAFLSAGGTDNSGVVGGGAGGGAPSSAVLGPAAFASNGKLEPARAGITAYVSETAPHACEKVGAYQRGAPAPTPSDPGKSVAADNTQTPISCIVVKQGPFRFSGQVYGGFDPKSLDFSFTNGVIGSDFTGTADLAFFYYMNTAPCTITVDNQQIKAGAIWANFSCELGWMAVGACAIKGTFVFENCSGTQR